MRTLINKLLCLGLPNGLYFSKWLNNNGYSNQLIKHYKDSGWLESLCHGVFYRKGEKLNNYACLQSYNEQLNKTCRVGAHSALELYGNFHYVPMGHQRIYLFDTKYSKPNWIKANIFVDTFSYFTTETFSLIKSKKVSVGEYEVLASCPELAFLECLFLCPTYYDLLDVYYIMETLDTLNPNTLQELLSKTKNLKVKRLFLYMAEKANHYWYNMLDLRNIDLGTGKMQIVPNGVYIPKYKITIPISLYDYE